MHITTSCFKIDCFRRIDRTPTEVSVANEPSERWPYVVERVQQPTVDLIVDTCVETGFSAWARTVE